MSSEPRLGSPVELPWWAVALGMPPALVGIAGLILGAPLWAHVLVVAASFLVIAALMTITLRIASSNMQSVWISVVFAVWVFIAVVWAVAVATYRACNCA